MESALVHRCRDFFLSVGFPSDARMSFAEGAQLVALLDGLASTELVDGVDLIGRWCEFEVG